MDGPNIIFYQSCCQIFDPPIVYVWNVPRIFEQRLEFQEPVFDFRTAIFTFWNQVSNILLKARFVSPGAHFEFIKARFAFIQYFLLVERYFRA